MSKFISAEERIRKAWALIEKARKLTPVTEPPSEYFTYVAQVKDILRQGRDLVKFISYTPSASAEMKAEVARLFAAAEQAEKEILHPNQP
jgi:hypothetical protein